MLRLFGQTRHCRIFPFLKKNAYFKRASDVCILKQRTPFTLGHTYHSLVRDKCVDDRYQVPGQRQAEQS